MFRLVVICFGVCGSLLALINGIYMLVSPSAWFRLPSWMRASGGLHRSKYSSGWGALQIRFVGALIVGFYVLLVGSIAYDEFFRARGG